MPEILKSCGKCHAGDTQILWEVSCQRYSNPVGSIMLEILTVNPVGSVLPEILKSCGKFLAGDTQILQVCRLFFEVKGKYLQTLKIYIFKVPLIYKKNQNSDSHAMSAQQT